MLHCRTLLHTLVHIASELSVPPGLRLATSPPRPSKAKATANPLTKSKIAKQEDFYILKKGLQNLKTAIYKKNKLQMLEDALGQGTQPTQGAQG